MGVVWIVIRRYCRFSQFFFTFVHVQCPCIIFTVLQLIDPWNTVYWYFWYEDGILEPMFFYEICLSHHSLQFEPIHTSRTKLTFHNRNPSSVALVTKTSHVQPFIFFSKKSWKKSQMFSYIDQLRFTSGAMIFKNFQILGHPTVLPQTFRTKLLLTLVPAFMTQNGTYLSNLGLYSRVTENRENITVTS